MSILSKNYGDQVDIMSADNDDEKETGEEDDAAEKKIESILNEPIHFEDLIFEIDVPQVDEIEDFCNYYVKHCEKAKYKDIKRSCEFQIFEVICVCAWNTTFSCGGTSKWGALANQFDIILGSYPMQAWWRDSLMKFLPASEIPEGVENIANEMRVNPTISKTWRTRYKTKIACLTESEICVLYFGSKIEDVAKKAVSQVNLFYNRLYRTPIELPSGSISMSHLYRAIKNCLFSVEKKALYLQRRKRQFYRERDRNDKHLQLSKMYLMEGFEDFIREEKSTFIVQNYFPKHWLSFHMCSSPINDRFPNDFYVSVQFIIFV